MPNGTLFFHIRILIFPSFLTIIKNIIILNFIQAFLKVQDLFLSVDDFNLVFEDFAEYLSEDNIVYCEAFFAPSAFIKKGFNYKDMIDVFTKNIVKIKRKKNITIKLIRKPNKIQTTC